MSYDSPELRSYYQVANYENCSSKYSLPEDDDEPILDNFNQSTLFHDVMHRKYECCPFHTSLFPWIPLDADDVTHVLKNTVSDKTYSTMYDIGNKAISTSLKNFPSPTTITTY